MGFGFNAKKERKAAQEQADKEQHAEEQRIARAKQEEAARARQALLDETIKLGRTASPEDFSSALTEGKDKNMLANGAAEALVQDDHPANMQVLLTALIKAKTPVFYLLAAVADYALQEKGSEQAAALIKRAIEKFPAAERQELLDNTLGGLVTEYKGSDADIGVLLGAGADANGFKGSILAYAIAQREYSTVKQLRANGAEYKDALSFMQEAAQKDKRWGAAINKLYTYQEYDRTDQLEKKVAALTAGLEQAKRDITDLRSGKTPAPATQSQAAARTPVPQR